MLRHIARVAKFLDDNKPKTSLKKRIHTVTNLIDLIRFHLICQMLAKLQGLNPKGPYLSLEKKRQFLCCAHQYFIKRASIRKFHVEVVLQQLRNVQNSMMQEQSCCFANIITYCF